MAAAWRWLAAALVVAVGSGLGIETARGQTAASDAVPLLQRAAAQVRQLGRPSPPDSNEPLRSAFEWHDRQRLIAVLSAVAVTVIAREPHRYDEVLAAAAAAAPEVAGEVRQRIRAAFPVAATPVSPRPRGNVVAAARAGPAEPPPPRGREYAGAGPALADTALLGRRRAQADADYAARLEAWLVGAVARDPAGREAHLASAVAAMPEARERLVAAIARAFPAYGAQPPSAAGAPIRGDREEAVARATETPSAETAFVGPESVWDPLEPMNRMIDSVNQAIDFVVLRPIATVYSTLAPDPVILAVRRFFENLRQPVVIANDLMQLTFEDAAVAAGRFGVNTTIGLLGFFDPATGMGLEAHYADFGQTLHSYGVGPGPYLVLPLLGPSTVRDGVGEVVDSLLQPYGYFLPQTATVALTGSKAVVKRERLLVPLDELKASSVDYYSSLRSAYYQRRAIELSKGRGALEAPEVETERLFDEAR